MWQRLYFLSKNDALTADQIADALRTAISSAGYTLYDPFGLMPGLSYPTAIKLFVAPVSPHPLAPSPLRREGEHTTQTPPLHEMERGLGGEVIASPDPIPDVILATASETLAAMAIALTLNADSTAAIRVWDNGVQNDASLDLLVGETGRAALSAIRKGDPLTIERLAPPLDAPAAPQIAAIPLDALPPDVQTALASGKGVSGDAADKLFAKMSGMIGGKLDATTAAQAGAASALLHAHRIDWNTTGARQIRALCALLRLPAPSDPPDFNTLREAYQLHARKRRKPDAPDYPGDAEAMAAVPDALDYRPVYGGKR
jgi:hypothetical protein